MKEQSHKDEMSAALRGDFERLRDRGVSSTLATVEPEPAPEDDAPGEREPETERPAAEPVRHGWRARLFG